MLLRSLDCCCNECVCNVYCNDTNTDHKKRVKGGATLKVEPM